MCGALNLKFLFLLIFEKSDETFNLAKFKSNEASIIYALVAAISLIVAFFFMKDDDLKKTLILTKKGVEFESYKFQKNVNSNYFYKRISNNIIFIIPSLFIHWINL